MSRLRLAVRKLRTNVVLLVVIICSGSMAQAQLVPGEYEKKAVLLVDFAVRTSGAPRLSESQQNRLVTEVMRATNTGRFDTYTLPSDSKTRSKLIKSFPDPVTSLSSMSGQLDSIVLPDLLRAIRARQEQSAQALSYESYSQRFLVQKAKELLIDEEMLRRIYQFTYIAVPFIDSISDERKDVFPTVMGGIAWFTLSVDEESASIEYAFDTRANNASVAHVSISGKVDCFTEFGEALGVAIRERAEFQMTTQILEVRGSKLFLTVGRHDGVAIDDKYFVYENVEDGKRDRLGFVRITKLRRDDSSDPVRSEATIVNGRTPRRGMQLEEIHVGSWEQEIGGTIIRYRVSGGILGEVSTGHYVLVPNSDAQQVYAAQLGASRIVGRSLGIPQLYCGMRFLLGMTKVGFRTHEGDGSYDEPSTVVGGIDIGICRRSYFRMLGIELGTRIGLLYFRGGFRDSVNSIEYDISTLTCGGSVEGGLSVWVTPSLTIRFLTAKKWFDQSPAWEVKRNKQKLKIDESICPRLLFDPIEFKIIVAYSGRSVF